MTIYRISREELNTVGGEEALNKGIANYTAALADHAKTEGVPAPIAHPWVEAIVKRGGGVYEIIEPPAPVAAVDDDEVTFEEMQERGYRSLRHNRMQAQKSGVLLHGVRFGSSPDSLTALLAAKIEAEESPDPAEWSDRWRVGPGNFVLINYGDVTTLIAMIRAKHKKAFAHERELSDAITSAITKEQLAAVDLMAGWGD